MIFPIVLGLGLAGLLAYEAISHGKGVMPGTEVASYTAVTLMASDQSVSLPRGKLLAVNAPQGGAVLSITPPAGFSKDAATISIKGGIGQVVESSMGATPGFVGIHDYTVKWTAAGAPGTQTTVLHVTSTDPAASAPTTAAPAAGVAPVTIQLGDAPMKGVVLDPGTPINFVLPTGMQWSGLSLALPGQTLANFPVSGLGTAPASTVVPPMAMPLFLAQWGSPSNPGGSMGAVAVLPKGATLLAPVTDASLVSFMQGKINELVGNQASSQFPPTYPGLTAVPVNGNPNDPAFQTALAQIQSFAATQMPAGWNLQLRTDGVLDYASVAFFSMLE